LKLVGVVPILALSYMGIAQAQNPRSALPREVGRARDRVYPALVNITVVTRYFSDGRAQRAPSGGSGVIVSPQGYVLTNYHVAGNATRITCTLPSGESIDARVVAHDPPTDLSVLKLRTERRKSRAPLPYATLGRSSALEIGQPVIAMGNPMMLASSLTVGVVSNTKRVFTDFAGSQIQEQVLDDGERAGMFTRWIQHDALILPGNSGGPLVNFAGEVVGINELGGAGVGFAIPSDTASRVLRQVLAHGEVRRGWLGITIAPVGKLGRKEGALVAAVAPQSPASKAGIAPGDVLLSLGEKSVRVRFAEEIPLLYQEVADLPIGQVITARLIRGGKIATRRVKIARMLPYVGEEEELRKLGVSVRGITDAMAVSRRLPTKQGVLVTGVRAGFPLETAKPSISEGDVITSIGGAPVVNVAAFRKVIARLKDGDVPILFRRGYESWVTVARVETPEEAQDNAELPKAWIGVKTQVLTPQIAHALKIPGKTGFRVTEVFPGTQAAKAGLRAGDVITAINDSALEASRPQDEEDLRQAIEELSVGEKAKLTIIRAGNPGSVGIKLEATPASAPNAKSRQQEELEFTVRELTPLDRMERRWSLSQRGVLVSETTAGGWAQMAGLRVEDLIVSVQGRPVSDLGRFESAIRVALARKPRVITLFVQRGDNTDFVFIEPDWSNVQGRK